MTVSADKWPRLRRYWSMRQGLRSSSSKASIVLTLLLLVLVLFAGMWVLSALNLRTAQDVLVELRREQIDAKVWQALSSIESRQQSFAQYARNLASAAALALDDDAVELGRCVDDRLARALPQLVSIAEAAESVTVWLSSELCEQQQLGLVLHMRRGGELRTADEALTAQAWYSALQQSAVTALRQGELRWTPVYYDASLNQAVTAVVAPVQLPDGRWGGAVSAAWGADLIIDLVSRVEVTEDSFSFLLDSNNRNLTSLSRSNDVLRAQRLLDAVVAEDLLAQNAAEATELQRRELQVDAELFELSFSSTPAGMVFGIGVPRADIESVLVEMQRTNRAILFFTALVLILVSSYLVYRIVALLRELQASYTDGLTGLPNRVGLLRVLAQGHYDALLLLNIDRFKEINGLFGQSSGDYVLRDLSRYLQSTAQANMQIFRVQADEFVLLWGRLPTQSGAELARKIGDLVRNWRGEWAGQILAVDCTVGLTLDESSDAKPAPDVLLTQATIALRLAREQRKAFAVYHPEAQIERVYADNLARATQLREALQQGRILPHFQPIRDNRSGLISKYECLVRLQTVEGEVISAGRFLDIARRLRLDRQLTRVMINSCFALFTRNELEFALNLSYADLMDPELVDLLTGQLARTGLGARLTIELLETDGIENYDAVREFIERVKPYGCRIAIDDFGTGYSNFGHLASLRIDIIKIDGSLISQLHEDETALKVTQGIVQFARSLGIVTVAEYVHCEPVQLLVEQLGIDYSQGSLFGMPRAVLPSVNSDATDTVV